MKALVGAFNQEKALVGAFSVVVQPVVEPMEHYTALLCIVLRWMVQEMGRLLLHSVIHDPLSSMFAGSATL